MKIGPYTLKLHRGTVLEKLKAQAKTHDDDPVLKPREPGSAGSGKLPRFELSRTRRLDKASAPPQDGVYPKWKGDERFIIAADSADRVTARFVEVQVIRYGVPPEKTFHLQANAKKPQASFGTLLPQDGSALSGVTLAHRLDIHAHGDDRGVWIKTPRSPELSSLFQTMPSGRVGIGPTNLSILLKRAGLQEVGVLKFQSCKIGKGDFLDRLLKALDEQGIRVGYLSAHKGTMVAQMNPLTIGKWKTTFKVLPILPEKMVHVVPETSKKGYVVPETFAIKVIKGNVDIAFPGTRYALKDPTGDLPKPQQETTPAAVPPPIEIPDN